MTPSEAAAALTLCAAYDRRTIGEPDARAWAEALPDIAFADAKAAIVAHYREARDWIMPSDILARVRKMRRDRMADADKAGALTLDPPQTDDVAADVAWRREYRRALGDGHDLATADRIACSATGLTRPAGDLERIRPVAQLVAAAANDPRDLDPRARAAGEREDD